MIEEKKWDNSPEDELRHDVTDELAAYKLAQIPFPGVFGVFYENDRPTKNALEKKWIDTTREKLGNPIDLAAASEDVRPDEVIDRRPMISRGNGARGKRCDMDEALKG